MYYLNNEYLLKTITLFVLMIVAAWLIRDTNSNKRNPY